jgi:hypothetical protein
MENVINFFHQKILTTLKPNRIYCKDAKFNTFVHMLWSWTYPEKYVCIWCKWICYTVLICLVQWLTKALKATETYVANLHVLTAFTMLVVIAIDSVCKKNLNSSWRDTICQYITRLFIEYIFITMQVTAYRWTIWSYDEWEEFNQFEFKFTIIQQKRLYLFSRTQFKNVHLCCTFIIVPWLSYTPSI